MEWQMLIFTRLSLDDNTPKIITDQTGILSSGAFISWANKKNIDCQYASSISQILALTTNAANSCIITSLNTIPAFITHKFIHCTYSFTDLPLNGDIHKALPECTADDIVLLLDYVFETNRHQVLSRHDISKLLHASRSHQSNKEIDELLGSVSRLLLQTPSVHHILELSDIWGKLMYLSSKTKRNNYYNLIPQIDSYAEQFVMQGGMEQAFYASTSGSPKTVDKLLANIKSHKGEKVALLCFDCMGFSEWCLLQEYLSVLQLSFETCPVFTLLPSVTSVSRSAIFQGNTDVYNLKSPSRKTEAKAFASYFSDKETAYFTEKESITDDSLTGYNYISILFNFFDDLCHSVQFPASVQTKDLYFDAVRAYLEKSNLLQVLQTLQTNGFAIYLCSDHGSVVAKGNGQPLDKYLVDKFAKRAVIVSADTDNLIDLKKINIPFVDDKRIVLPEGRTMFAHGNKTEVNHGGITIEEMIVPFIRVIK